MSLLIFSEEQGAWRRDPREGLKKLMSSDHLVSVVYRFSITKICRSTPCSLLPTPRPLADHTQNVIFGNRIPATKIDRFDCAARVCFDGVFHFHRL